MANENIELLENDEPPTPEENTTEMEELSDDDLEEVAGGWDGDGGG